MNRPKRKAIPAAVKLTVFLRQDGRCAACHQPIESAEYDHRPALISRPVNADGTDYEPAQNDPNFIEALDPECHQQRTTGRKPGALRTVTTKGSDIGIKTKFARLARKEKLAQTKKFFAGRKPGTLSEWAKIIGGGKIPSRPFPKKRKPAVDGRRR